jgi:integrase
MSQFNIVSRMGRKKKGYRAPEGLIRIEGSPYWWIKLPFNGKILKKSTKVPFENITKATIILRGVQKRLLEKVDKVAEILGESIPFDDLADRYLKEVSPGKRSGGSDKTNSIYPKKYFGKRRADTIRTIDLGQYQDWRKAQISERTKRPVSGATINREMSFISCCFKKAVFKWGYLEKNPCREIERFSEKRKKRYIFDREFDAIKEKAAKNPKATHLPDIMDALYNTGLREGKVLGLEWPQVHLEERFIGFEEGPENKGVPERVYINDRLLEIFMRLKRERLLRKVVGRYVFQKDDGSRYKSIRKAWKTACREANVVGVRIHDIRHKTATDLGDRGFTPAQIALVLAHLGTSQTDRYTHLQSTKKMLESLAK